MKMKLICSLAMSVNGYVARPDGQEDFLSAANWDDFLKFTKKLDNFIVGRKSFEVIKKLYKGKSFGDSEAKHKIIVTTDKSYAAEEGFVVCHSPKEAVEYLKDKVEYGLLIGGSGLNTSFAKANSIDEFWLTIDPNIIGDGYNLFNRENIDIKVEFVESEMFSEGRLRVKYRVLR